MTSRTHWKSTLAGGLNYRTMWWGFVVAALLLGTVSIAFAGSTERDQAFRMYNRIAGVPPSTTVLSAMESDIVSGGNGPVNAALRATHDPHFYTVTLKNFAAPWTNREHDAFVPLNDYTTLVIGMVKDDVPFNQILSADLLYVDKNQALPSPTSNAHYEQLEQSMLQAGFDPETEIVATTQSGAYGLPPAATAGAITTRAASKSFFIAGTNRAMFRFTLVNHMCTDMEQVHDISIVPDRIRQDVSRSPGGDSRVFLNNCIGCHAGMDPMAQAFAYYNYDDVAGRLVYTPGVVQPKYLKNPETFPDGFATPDDSWHNYWREGQNASLGWDPNLPGSGVGAKTLGQEFAATDAFAACQVKKVFKDVCLRDPVDAADRAEITSMAGTFKAGGYNLRQVFAQSAVYCMGN